MQNDIDIICPSCGGKCYFCLDICLNEWGFVPIHLHCDKCNINIIGTSFKECIDLLQKHNK